MLHILLQMTPHARQEIQVMRLMIAHGKARKNTDDLTIALRAEHGICAKELLAVAAGGGDITIQHLLCQRRRHIAAGVFQKRD